MTPAPSLPAAFATRWAQLARAVGLEPAEPVLLALSGGADSVLLLHLLAAARPRPPLCAVHVDHGLRGAASREDAAFCARLCRSLGVPLVRRRAALDPQGPSLEARAREARYALLVEEARRAGVATILTGHHADDALETLLMRWVRGTHLGGLAGLKAVRPIAAGAGAPALRVARPLIGMRREEVRRLLASHGLAWREDLSNASPAFTRNRVRHVLLPGIEASCGPAALENLRAFGRAVELLEDRLAARTAHIAWEPPAHAPALRSRGEASLGGSLPRAALMEIVAPLRKRALWRLVLEGTGRAPARRLVALVAADLDAGRCTRHSLPGGWSLALRSDRVHLTPPEGLLAACRIEPAPPARARQLELPFEPTGAPPTAHDAHAEAALTLALPGLALLPDGRAVSAELVEPPRGSPVPRSSVEVELDAAGLGAPLALRYPRPGDRFHALGAPGARKLARFLADAGVPREERGRVPLVVCGAEILWACGLRPSETRRVRPETARRLRLALHQAAPAEAPAAPGAGLFDALREAG